MEHVQWGGRGLKMAAATDKAIGWDTPLEIPVTRSSISKFLNGTTITRASGDVEVTPRSCVLIKHEAFQPESRRAFRKGMNHIKPTLLSEFIQPCTINE